MISDATPKLGYPYAELSMSDKMRQRFVDALQRGHVDLLIPMVVTRRKLVILEVAKLLAYLKETGEIHYEQLQIVKEHMKELANAIIATTRVPAGSVAVTAIAMQAMQAALSDAGIAEIELSCGPTKQKETTLLPCGDRIRIPKPRCLN